MTLPEVHHHKFAVLSHSSSTTLRDWNELLSAVCQSLREFPEHEELHHTRRLVEEQLSRMTLDLDRRLQGNACSVRRIHNELADGSLCNMTREAHEKILTQVRTLKGERQKLLERCNGEMSRELKGLVEEADPGALERVLTEVRLSTAEQELYNEETIYLRRLETQFHIVSVPKDGNCLFQSVHLGTLAAAIMEDNAAAMTTDRLMTFLAKELKDTAARMQVAQQLRVQAVATMKLHLGVYGPPIAELLSRCWKTHQRDATTLILQTKLKQQFPEEAYPQGPEFGSKEAIDIYLDVMQCEGVFGEVLEIQALSQHLKHTILIYHKFGEQTDQQGSQMPAEQFGAEYGGPEIHLFHLVSGSHFTLLIPRKWKGKSGGHGCGSESGISNSNSNGNGCGSGRLGMVIEMHPVRNYVIVAALTPRGVAARSGVKVGDALFSVDGKNVLGYSEKEIKHLLLGPPNTQVEIVVWRQVAPSSNHSHGSNPLRFVSPAGPMITEIKFILMREPAEDVNSQPSPSILTKLADSLSDIRKWID